MSGECDLDDEDVMECKCYMIFCVTPNKEIYTDRVYRNRDLAQKRVEYMNTVSQGRGQWMAVLSELGM